MNIPDLEANLAQAQIREKNARSSGSLKNWKVAHEECLEAERALGLTKGEETALPCEWEARWDMGAPLPHVISSGYKTYLLYLVNEPDPNWDGSYVTVINPTLPDAMPLALVEFIGCLVFKFGAPNDEVFEGHPLYGKGLAPYAAHEIANSQWLAELERINSVHYHYNPSGWKELKHYMLLFHDEMFECIAEGHRIEILRDSFEHALEIARKRHFERD